MASEELKSKRRSKTQKETPEKPSPHGQDKIDEIDVEDPPPWQARVSISTDKDSR